MADELQLTRQPLGSHAVADDMERENGESEGMWDGWEYMRAKKRKLREQFAGLDQKPTSDIFEGVTIYVNGWTQPNADELKRLIHAHGGQYEYNLYGDSGVTHTIATNLPNVKIRNLKDACVCTPDWIVESVASGRRLPEDNYLLYARHPRDQKELNFKKEEPRKPDGFSSEEGLTELTRLTVPSEAVPAGQSVSNDSLESMTPKAKPGQYNATNGAAFVSDYYTHSRLHHLSKWSTELKQFTCKTLPRMTQKRPKLPARVSLRGHRKRLIAHVDLDCFFVSVSLRDRPHLKGCPVAVCHAKLPKEKAQNQQNDQQDVPRNDTQCNQSPGPPPPDGESAGAGGGCLPQHLLKSMSDVASCSYEARDAGVHNGMFVGQALKLCPKLQLLPYEFDKYHKVSKLFYTVLMSHSACLEAVSCDEAYIELTDYVPSVVEAEKVVQEIRDEVKEATGCTVSAGVAHNMLLARMATRIAKPNGQYFLSEDKVYVFLGSQKVRDLPGVGYSTALKFREAGVETCAQLRQLSLSRLKSDFGSKTGEMLYNYCRGRDDRELKLVSERKSISVDLNYGIRFQSLSDAENLLKNLSEELGRRAVEAGVLGGTLTLKLMVRRLDAPTETRKYLGHGRCNNMSRSLSLLQPTSDAAEMCRLATRLLKQMNPPPEDVRGVGMQLTRLVSTTFSSSSSSATSQLAGCFDLRSMLAGAQPLSQLTSLSVMQEMPPVPSLPSTSKPAGQPQVEATNLDETFAIDVPPASQLDSSVLEALPPELADKILRCYDRGGQSSETSETPGTDGDAKKKPPLKPPTHTSPRDETVGRRGRGRGRGRGKGRGSGSPIRSPLKRTAASSSSREGSKNQIRLFEVLAGQEPAETRHHQHKGGASDTIVPRQATTSEAHKATTDAESIGGDESATITSCEVTQDEFISEFRAYLKEWVYSSPSGPVHSDLEKVVAYTVDLCSNNLEAVFVVLQSFRRVTMNQGCTEWSNAFNSLLESVQGCTHNATLPIDKIYTR